MSGLVRRKSMARRMSTRTSSSLNKVDSGVQRTKNEEKVNMNALIIKNLGYTNPQTGKNSVYYSYTDSAYKTIDNSETYLDILDIGESLLHKEDNQSVALSEYHQKKKKLKCDQRKKGEEINELEIDSYRSMRNKLTYCERGSETIHKNIIQRDVETKKLNRINHDGMFHEWDLFDSYMATFIQILEKKRMDEEIKMKGFAVEKKKKRISW